LKRGDLDKGFLSQFFLGERAIRPVMLFNTTSVETGRKAIISNVAIDDVSFPGCMDVFQFTQKDIPLKTAASISARFAYITPQATIEQRATCKSLDLVDGGYADNSGLETALQVIVNIHSVITHEISSADPVYRRIQIHLLYIQNSGTTIDKKQSEFLHELLIPERALLTTRSARGLIAGMNVPKVTKAFDATYTYREFSLPWKSGDETTVQYPLGWYLSGAAADSMKKQTDTISWRTR
jgi:hypothetical protein